MKSGPPWPRPQNDRGEARALNLMIYETNLASAMQDVIPLSPQIPEASLAVREVFAGCTLVQKLPELLASELPRLAPAGGLIVNCRVRAIRERGRVARRARRWVTDESVDYSL